MKLIAIAATVSVAALLTGCKTSESEMGNLHQELNPESFYLPNAEASRVVSVATDGQSRATVLIQTQRVAVKEGGPKETVAKFGEVYAFSPTFVAVYRDEPTLFRFWNLQPDDNHSLMLMNREQVFLNQLLPPLEEKSFVFTFHQEGLFNFICTMHPVPMNGQILVLPPRSSAP